MENLPLRNKSVARELSGLRDFYEDVGKRLRDLVGLLSADDEFRGVEVAAAPPKLSKLTRGRVTARIRWHMRFLAMPEQKRVLGMMADGRLEEAATLAKQLNAERKVRQADDRSEKRSMAGQPGMRRKLAVAWNRMSPAQQKLKVKFMRSLHGLPKATRSRLRGIRAQKGYAVAIKAAKAEGGEDK